MIKLPKQWKHWCQKAGLKPDAMRRNRSIYQWFNLKGHGLHWRLNCYNMFQCGDTYEEFDRWARCDIEELPCPTTEAEFVSTVKSLLVKQNINACSVNEFSSRCCINGTKGCEKDHDQS